ncbi:putative methyltransferase [Triangularia setosa]|uniref:Methyltransferase n=1 Tax=Triangularia setosa TaxID=2587417 RepID=A0AAN6W855_9PEZI|nr:putative methyltransferase [Podospora setosa]
MSGLLELPRELSDDPSQLGPPIPPQPKRSSSKAPPPSTPRPIPEDEAFSQEAEGVRRQPEQFLDLIEAEEGPEEEDEFLAEGWDGSSKASTSVTSSIYAHTYENGRRYHSYRYGRYPIPNDDQEQNREDMKHAMMMELTDGKLHLSPIGPNPQKIIDIGTGTGIWAIEMGDLFPGAEILGLDLSPIQPQWVPPNVRFMIDDVEDEWANGSNWDFVHLRGMALVLRDLQKAVDQIYRHLRPGGWIEFQESHGEPCCDDGTMNPETDVMKKFYALVVEAMAKFGMNLNMPAVVGEFLERAGFVNITCVRKKTPVGTWPKDKTMRLIGLYVREAALQSLSALGKAFANLGMDAVEREVFSAKVREAVMDGSVHRYYYFYFWFAQKPYEDEGGR